MKKIVVLWLALWVGVSLQAESLAIGEDGNFVSETGTPFLVLGAQFSGARSIVSFVRNVEKIKVFPALHSIYQELPCHDNMTALGFNSMCFNTSLFWYRMYSPEYKGYTERLRWETYDREMKAMPGVNRYYRAVWLENTQELFREIRLPLYVETHRLSEWARKPELTRKFVGDSALGDFKNSSAFALPFALGTPEGRGLVLNMWRHAALSMKYENAEVYAYELFNEPKYADGSPANRSRFIDSLKQKYGSLGRVNAAWNTNYSSWEAIAVLPETPEHAAFRVAFDKFQEDQVTRVCAEGKKIIQEISPRSATAVQLMGHDTYRRSWHHFNLHAINRETGVVNAGTGNHQFNFFARQGRTILPFAEMPDVAANIRDNLTRMKVMRAIADGKPLVNGECYTTGSPEKLHAILWNEVMRGQNAIYLFEWGGYGGDAKTAMTYPFQLLNQNFFPSSGFRVIGEAKAEIDSLADFILPRRHRVPADCAVLFSYPTIRYDRAVNSDFADGLTNAVMALQFSHYPNEVIFEEQLPEKLKKYRALLAFGARNSYPETLSRLESFVREGGVLIAGKDVFTLDEYGKPVVSWFSRLRKGVPEGRKEYGRGAVWFVNRELADYPLAETLGKILAEQRIQPALRLFEAGSDNPAANVETHAFKQDGMTLFYLCNLDSFPRSVELGAKGLERMVDPFKQRTLPVAAGRVRLVLPVVGRTLLAAGSPEKLRARFGEFAERTEAELQRELETENERTTAEKRRDGRCLDLSKFANYGFDNQQNWPVGTAWFDDRDRDLKGVPWHENIFGGVAFDLIRMDFNDNRTCIALRSAKLPEAPAAVTGIPVNEKVGSLSFLYAVTGGVPGEKAFTLRFHYADGSRREAPVTVGENIGDWRWEDNASEVRKLFAWKNEQGLGFCRWEWRNPSPEKMLLALDLISAEGRSTPIVVALSTHPVIKQKEHVFRFEGWKLEGGKRRGKEIELSMTSWATFHALDGKRLPVPPAELADAEVCFSINNRPDEAGNPVQLVEAAVLNATGLRDGAPCRSGASAHTDSRLFSRSYAVLDSDPATWQEIRVPLSLVLKDNQGKAFDEVTSLGIRSHQRDCTVLIRDFRVEW